MDPVQVGNPGLVLALLFIHTILCSGEQQKQRRPPAPSPANTVIMAASIPFFYYVCQGEALYCFHQKGSVGGGASSTDSKKIVRLLYFHLFHDFTAQTFALLYCSLCY